MVSFEDAAGSIAGSLWARGSRKTQRKPPPSRGAHVMAYPWRSQMRPAIHRRISSMGVRPESSS